MNMRCSPSGEPASGSVSKEIHEIREQIIYEIAFIESALDDPEHISLDGYGENLLKVVFFCEEEA